MVRQRGSHIRLQKRVGSEILKITVPAHRPVKRSTLAHILKQARLSVDDFLEIALSRPERLPKQEPDAAPLRGACGRRAGRYATPRRPSVRPSEAEESRH